MKSVTKLFSGLLVASLLMGGCSLLGANNPNSETALQTSVANTVVALQKEIAINATPTMAQTMTSTVQTLPTFTPAATIQIATVALPTATSQPEYLISDVQDITAPDNSVFKPGEAFTKTWRLTNGGNATWASDFSLVYVSGDQMGATTVTLGRSVAPNQTIDISVNLTAPSSEGTYKGNFMLQTSSSKTFGLGSTGASPFWVKIIVQQFFQVSNATISSDPTSYSGACPGTVNLTASITSTAAGSVTYYYVTSTGTSSSYTMTFTAAGTQTSSAVSWPIIGPDPLSVYIYIDNPNHQGFSPVSVPVTCTP